MIVRALIASLLLCGALNMAHAQVIATTEDGKKVVLKKDGTWQYMEDYLKGDKTTPKKKSEEKTADATTTPSTKAVTMEDFACGDIIASKMNPQTQKENKALAEDLVVSEEDDQYTFSTSLGVNDNKTYSWDMSLKGIKGCATETPTVMIGFADGSKIKLSVTNDYVCDKKISLFLSKGLGNKNDLKKLRANSITKLTVETKKGMIEEDLDAEQGAILQKAFNCLNGK